MGGLERNVLILGRRVIVSKFIGNLALKNGIIRACLYLSHKVQTTVAEQYKKAPREFDIYNVLLCTACKYMRHYNCVVQGNMVLPEAVIFVD